MTSSGPYTVFPFAVRTREQAGPRQNLPFEYSSSRFGSILLKNSKMHSLHFLAKLNRDRQFGL
jgi:hypothetical protein